VNDTKPAEEAAMDIAAQEMERDAKRATELMDADPSLPFISALVIARDMASADRSMQWLRDGTHDWGRAEVFCGSYGRLDLRVRAREEGLITDEQAFADLASTWSGSDPDDTDPRFLSLWKDAVKANGGLYLRDPEDATLPGTQWLTIFRGQDYGVPFGIAWSLDLKVAMKFANGAATRQHNRGGTVYRAIVKRSDVLGYMTGRHEAEVIVDPATITMVERP
jgi:hypothetical protein